MTKNGSKIKPTGGGHSGGCLDNRSLEKKTYLVESLMKLGKNRLIND